MDNRVIGDKVIKTFDFYSRWMASDGQISTQVPQSTHFSFSTFALSLFMQMASAGQASMQVSHPAHCSLSMIATKQSTSELTY